MISHEAAKLKALSFVLEVRLLIRLNYLVSEKK